MTTQTFKQFLVANWTSYLFATLGPVFIFLVSFFVTNMGWKAIPIGFAVVVFMCGLTTLTLYQRWWIVENIMRDVKANCRTTNIPPK